jgi:hypothetical protein
MRVHLVHRGRTRHLWIAAAVAVATLIAVPGAAGATRSAIAPNQTFVGLVNGSTGLTTPAPIYVACAGPINPGETTHPLAGQTLEVEPASDPTDAGNTGPLGDRISAFQGVPPSAAGATSSRLPTFRSYDAAKPLPTTITVPCTGTGDISFLPFPRDPGASRAFVVSVEFVNLAV